MQGISIHEVTYVHTPVVKATSDPTGDGFLFFYYPDLGSVVLFDWLKQIFNQLEVLLRSWQ